jgi:hypothetical protein
MIAAALLGLSLAALPSEGRDGIVYAGSRSGEWKQEYKDGSHEFKHERKGREWKSEYKDRFCEVKRERKSSGEYKEEIKCK